MIPPALNSDPIVRVPQRLRAGASVAALAVSILALAGCGGGGSGATTTSAGSTPTGSTAVSVAPVADPNAVVVQVGRDAITKAMFAHALAAAGKDNGDVTVPVPPRFTACVEESKAAGGGSASTNATPPSASASALQCADTYHGLETEALDELIVDDWVSGAAAEEGVSVNERQVESELKKEEKHPRFYTTIAATGRTVADRAREIRAQLLEEGLRRSIREKTASLSHAQIENYYAGHKSLFGVPERRDLKIARVSTKSEAEKIKLKLASGTSFATLVKTLTLQQPIYSNDGLVLNYESGMYAEQPLNQAILDARPGVLSGPIGIFLGYYVFEVTRTHPAEQKTLAQSEAAIRATLPGELYEQELVSFISDWRARWTARTDCMPGYVVPKCRQYKPTVGFPPTASDPYTFG